MKRFTGILSLLMILCLCLPLAAEAGVTGSLNQKMATRSGPGTKYTEELGTYPASTSITVISQVENGGTVWYQVEFAKNGELYRCYTGKKRVNTYGSVPYEKTVGDDDVLTENVIPLYGPGNGYASRWITQRSGTAVKVFWIEGNWALCEFQENGKWARGYIETDCLQYTEPEEIEVYAEPEEQSARISNILDPDQKLCVDYYGEIASYAGHSEEVAMLIGVLPVMEYFDGVPCVIKRSDVYSGPSYEYWRRWLSWGDYAATGSSDTNLRVYCQENGFILIRYPSGTNKGFRNGWVIPQTISVANQNRTPRADFAHVAGLTSRYTFATDDPDASLDYIGTSISETIQVDMLAFLNDNYDYVYCEFTYQEGSRTWPARGFIPSSDLTLK